jgi:hypothetical protein
MRNTIEGFRQDYLLKLHLTTNDALVLRWLLTFFQSDKILYKDILNKETGEIERFYWIDFDKVKNDLPILYITNKNVIGKMMTRLCGIGQPNENWYPIKKYNDWNSCKYGNKVYYKFRFDILSFMEGNIMPGFAVELGLPDAKIETNKNKINKNLLIQTENVLKELDKLTIANNKRLFSFTMPKDHKIIYKNMLRFQSMLQDLWLGTFIKNNRADNDFIERNKYYITEETYSKIKDCRGNWDKIKELVFIAAKNYSTWFEPNRESTNKNWLTRDIANFMYDPIANKSMFLISLIHKATITREVIAESIYNKIPNLYKNYFEELYDTEWDGLAYWNRIHSVHAWYRDNADDLIAENINYKYFLEDEGRFVHDYHDFINSHLGTKHLAHFGTKCKTWKWFMDEMKEQHGIEE